MSATAAFFVLLITNAQPYLSLTIYLSTYLPIIIYFLFFRKFKDHDFPLAVMYLFFLPDFPTLRNTALAAPI